MADDAKISFLKSLLAPRTLVLGVVGGFLLCCVLGRIVSERNPYENFARFHPHINYTSLYNPTPSQTLAIARQWMDQERIIVVVGGCSVLYGTGQNAEQLWTKRLQESLGDRYRVLNFALPAAGPFEFGAIAAEIIARDYPKVIFITAIWPNAGHSCGEPVGITEAYFYWDSYYKGLLNAYPPRDVRIAELAAEEKHPEQNAELKTRSFLDSGFYCQDLWTAFSYRCVSTVWCPQVMGSFSRPRRKYPDAERYIPLKERYTAAREVEWSAFSRQHIKNRRWAPAADLANPPDFAESPLAKSLVIGLPPHLRAKTIVIATHITPHYMHSIPEDEKADFQACLHETVQAIDAAGCRGVEIGRDYGDVDFADILHISGEGAVRIANDVAPHVREMAEQLGYNR